MRYVLLIFIVHSLYSAPSAFKAGDLSADTPYGLTDTEKAILGNKNGLKKNQKKIKNNKDNIKKITTQYNIQKQSIDSIKNELSTVKLLVTSNLSNFSKFKNDLNKIINNMEARVKYLEDKSKFLEETLNNVSSSNEALKATFLELRDIILNINDNFVSQEELNLLKKNIPQKPKPKMSNNKIETLAKDAYKRKKYNEAKNLYEELVKNNYRPARSNFKLGEIAYFQKKYKKAISLYAKSVNLYAKASYMPLLLYHTAMSYVYIRDAKQAKGFFDSLVSNFPKSTEAKWAKEELKKRYK